MTGSSTSVVTREEIRERLARVHDPELDESIVELEYVVDVRIDGGHVSVGWVLPTAWCSPTFAWMMATDIRDELERLPGVEEASVELHDHMHDAEINRGVNERLPFQEVFEDAEAGVEKVRHKLDRKARLARQYRAVEALKDASLDPAQIVSLTLDDLDRVDDRVVIYLHDDAVAVTVPAEPIGDYLEKARAVDVVTDPDDPLFAGPDGEPITLTDFESIHREARLAKSNMSGQGVICGQLHEARHTSTSSRG